MARKFFYICAGMLMLALSYHLGAGTAGAQAAYPITAVLTSFPSYLVTSNGDMYGLRFEPQSGAPMAPTLLGNVWGGSVPTNVTRESWGDVKARYRTPSGVGRATGR